MPGTSYTLCIKENQMSLFRDLNDDEVKEFEQWADEHQDESGDHCWSVIHPVIVARWEELGIKEEE
jgi:hypothetical protein